MLLRVRLWCYVSEPDPRPDKLGSLRWGLDICILQVHQEILHYTHMRATHQMVSDLLGTGIVAFSYSSYPVSTPTPSLALSSCLTLITRQSNVVHLFITFIHHTPPHPTYQEWIFCLFYSLLYLQYLELTISHIGISSLLT